MTLFLSADDSADRTPSAAVADVPSPDDMGDLKVFWGPEICRLEYLLHLLETGRVKDERRPRSA